MRKILNLIRALFADTWNMLTWPLRTVNRFVDVLFGRRPQYDEPARAEANEEQKVAADAARDEARSEIRNDLRAFRKLLTCQIDGRAPDAASAERLSPAVVAYVSRLTPVQCQKLLAAPAAEQLRVARGAEPQPTPVVDLAERREQLKVSARRMMNTAPTNDVDEVLKRMGRA